MKRFFCMLLVAAMLLSFMPVVSLQAAAADGIGIEYLLLSDLPENIEAGAAQIPSVEVLEGEVEIIQVDWRANEDEIVTTLLPDQAYFLAITVQPKDGYYFEDWIKVDTNRDIYSWVIPEERTYVLYYRYSMLEDAGTIHAQINEPYEGMDISALTCTVEGNATLEGIYVYDSRSGEMMEEGSFAPLSNYQITYVLEAKPGYEFANHGDLEVNGGEKYAEWSAEGEEMSFWIYFSTCPSVETVELSMSEIVLGGKLQDVQLTVAADAPYEITDYMFSAEDGEEVFEAGANYQLSYSLKAKEGYVFSENVQMYINGEVAYGWSYGDCLYAHGWLDISFGVDEISLWVLPDEIQPGAAELPEPECNQEVKITDVAWVNEAKQPVTAFEEGEVYYLAVTVEATGTRAFGYEPDLDVGWNHTATFEKRSDKQAVIYVRYSLEPSVGMVDISVSGTEIGDKIENMEVEINGNALFDQAIISVYVPMSYDSYTTEEPDSDVFEAGKTYLMECYLQPKPGYRFVDGSGITVEGEPTDDWGYRGDDMMVIIPISTCQEIDTVTLTMPEIKVGKAFSDLQVKVPANAKYSASIRWVDQLEWTEATGKVQEGHRYEAQIILQAEDGYIFAEDVAATLNGKKLDVSLEGYSHFTVSWIEKDFQKPITKVELPAMPTSIKKGDTLPVPTVSDSKNYTLTAFWGMMGGDDVSKAEADGIYLLVYSVYVKDGYAFNEDTKFYIGGKEVWPLESGWRDAQFLQNYNVGISEIDKVSFLSQKPEAGKPVPEVTVPENADYSLSQVTWGQSATNNWRTIQDDVKTLASGLYTFVYGMLEVKDGKALASKPSFYLNGQKTEPTAIYNFGQYAIVLFSLGKLGEVEKLTAPTLTKDGQLLSWNAVTNATGYEIYRATSKSGKYTKVATVAETAWSDSVTAGKTYYYKVKAIYNADSSKNSGFSSVVSIAYKCDAPEINVVNGETGKPVISWEKVSGAKKYTVYRATAVDGKYTKLGTSTKLTYTDSKATAGTEYFYKVIANASSSSYNSGYSNIESCYVICGTPSVTVKIDKATGKPSLSWSKVTGAVSYRILRQLPGEEVFTVLTEQTGTSFVDTTAPIDTECVYMVQVLGKTEALNGNPTKALTATSGIAQPKLKATVDSVSGKPVLTWEAVEGAVKYEIYRSTKSTKSYTLLTTVEGTAYVDESVAAGKTYYYKMVALGENSKSAETSYVKLTGKCATPEISAEINPDSGKPTISWQKVSGVKKYTVYRATSETGKYSKLGTTTKLSYTDSKATAGAQYFYKIVANASSSKYNSGYSNIVSCNVICGRPTITVKKDAATGKPSLSWSKVTGAVKYRIWRQLPGEAEFTALIEQTAVTFVDTTAPIDTECVYMVQVLGKTEELNGMLSKEAAVTSGIAQPKLKATVDSVSGKPVLTWEAVEGAVKYEIYRSTKSTKSYKLAETVEGTSYVDESVAAGKTYYYKMVALGENSKSAETSYVKLTGKCAVPTITVVNGSTGKPVVSWEKIAGAKKYTVYRATSVDGKYTSLGSTTKLTYTDTKAKSGTEYFYKIIANGSSKSYNSGYSNICMCYVICGTPSVTVKIDAATGKPTLSWNKVEGAAQYQILRQLPGEEDFTVIATQTALTFKDETAPIDTVCQYRVQALGAHEMLNGGFSPILTATSGIAKPQLQSGVNSEGQPRFNWQQVEGAVKYEVYRSTKSTKGYSLIATVEDGNAYADPNAAPGKTYYYKVKAVGAVSSSESAYVKLTGKCAAPWISIAVHETSGKPVISWEKVNGAKQYTVYRATSLEGKYTKLGTTKTLSYTDSKAVPGTEYYYKVIANGSKSSYNSNYSNVKFAVGYAAQPQVTLKNDSKGKPVVSWKKISEAEKYIVVYVDVTDVEDESQVTEQFVLDNLQYVEVSKKKTSVTLTQAQTGRIYMVCVVAMPKNEEFFAVSQPGYVAATCAAPKISGKYIQGYNCGIWKAVEGAEYYAIYRSTKASGGYELLGYIDNDSSFVDLSAVKGKTYYYKVTACTEYTESDFSNYIKLKTK